MVVPWICVAISKSQAICPKNLCFWQFFMLLCKKIQVVANRTILKPDALPIAHYEADVPYFSNDPESRYLCLSYFFPGLLKRQKQFDYFIPPLKHP